MSNGGGRKNRRKPPGGTRPGRVPPGRKQDRRDLQRPPPRGILRRLLTNLQDMVKGMTSLPDGAMPSRYNDLTHDELVRLLEARDRRDATRFGLIWEANEIERDNAVNADFVALDLIPERCVGAAPWRNLIIEGDNFDALRYLRMAYAGQVKCILIDPPYNTGKKDFVYNDRFVDENDSWRFSTWIEFLYQRLVIARDLLREDGVLLCCINDDNRAKLELLLDKVMPGMRIGSMAWRTRDSTSAKGRNFSDTHEHILIYGRAKFSFLAGKSRKRNTKTPTTTRVGHGTSIH